MTAYAKTRAEAIAMVVARLGPPNNASCVTEAEISEAMGVQYEISASARDLRYGRQGGRWAPPLRVGEEPFAVIGGKRVPCDEPVYARCGCGIGWWVAPSAIGTPCHVCGVALVERRAS